MTVYDCCSILVIILVYHRNFSFRGPFQVYNTNNNSSCPMISFMHPARPWSGPDKLLTPSPCCMSLHLVILAIQITSTSLCHPLYDISSVSKQSPEQHVRIREQLSLWTMNCEPLNHVCDCPMCCVCKRSSVASISPRIYIHGCRFELEEGHYQRALLGTLLDV
jgi:hypothetical protein